MKRMCKSKIFIILGTLCIVIALLITVYNITDNIIAGKRAEGALNELSKGIALDSLNSMTSDDIPLYKKYPEMDMPNIEIDGELYVGIIEIPALNINLPVRSEFSYKGLKTAPCKYDGSAYINNMIIAAHNYSSHFGNIKNLGIGDSVNFTDGDGNLFEYSVAEISVYNDDDVSGVKNDGDWDMTLFTCTLDGQKRVVVRLVNLK